MPGAIAEGCAERPKPGKTVSFRGQAREDNFLPGSSPIINQIGSQYSVQIFHIIQEGRAQFFQLFR
jgi:hypothetical protein